jgi:hypothetical protein
MMASYWEANVNELMCRKSVQPRNPMITTSFSSHKKQGFVCFTQKETNPLPHNQYTPTTRDEIPTQHLADSFKTVSAALRTLPNDVQANVRVDLSVSVSEDTHEACVTLKIAHGTLTGILNSPVIGDLVENCEDDTETSIPLRDLRGLLDSVALQIGIVNPYQGPRGAAKALYGVQVPSE